MATRIGIRDWYVFSAKGAGSMQAWGNALGVLHAKY